jgi:hypothetical protein
MEQAAGDVAPVRQRRLPPRARLPRPRGCLSEGQSPAAAREAVREWFMAFVGHKQGQFPFDDMIDNLERSGHSQALRDWLDGVQAQAGADAAAAR